MAVFELLNNSITLHGDGVIYNLKLFDLLLVVFLIIPDHLSKEIRCAVSVAGDIIDNKQAGRNKEA